MSLSIGLEICGVDPLRGRLVREGGEVVEFVGWLAFARRLEEMVQTAPPPPPEGPVPP